MATELRRLPSVERVLRRPELADLLATYPRPLVTDLVRATIEEARRATRDGREAPTIGEIAAAVVAAAAARFRPSLRPAINATGVILHTNLGRAPLSRASIAAMAAVAAGYSNLEFDLAAGERGSRHTHVEALLRQATGAEAGFAVNNNAAAVYLVLSAFAAGREVIVSRSQAVEIGGGFRVPDVLRQSGATLVEVGTTNRTYAADFEAAISERTAALLRVHSSNFRIIGFTHEPALAELAEIAHRRGVLLIDDLGSGCLLDTREFGLAPEPRVQESLAAGADVACFSGDKLLGGPQAGLIVGRAELIARLKRHPLARALRLDKATIAALNATLLHYIRGEAVREVPIWRMIATPLSHLETRACAWAAALGPAASVQPGESAIGGGSLPGATLPTCLLALSVPDPTALTAALRAGDPPLVARIEQDRVLLDPRTVDPGADETVVRLLKRALDGAPPGSIGA